MADNSLAPPNMPWLWQPNSQPGQPNGLGPPMLNYAAPPPDTSQGAGVAAAGQQAWQWLQDQRAESVRQGLLDPDTGLPTQKGVVEGLRDTAQGVMMGTTAPGEVPPPGIVAYHGSPHSFDQFDTSKIGTGEGAQAYGHGLYFAGNEGVARSYRDALSSDSYRPVTGSDVKLPSWVANHIDAGGDPATVRDDFAGRVQELQKGIDEGTDVQPWVTQGNIQGLNEIIGALDDIKAGKASVGPKGSMYQVNIGADPEHMLQWDQTVGQHPPALRDKLLDMGYGDTDRGADVYSHLARGPNGDVGASQRLQDAGIPGISYLDAGSRGVGTGTKNHVVFDANTIDILRKYGIAGLIAGGGAAAAGTQQQQPSQ